MVLNNIWQSLRRLTLSQAVERVGSAPDDTDEIRLQKTLVFIFACGMSLAGIVWGCYAYFVYQSALAALPPFGYVILTLLNVVFFALTRRFGRFRFIQLFLSLVLPFLMMARDIQQALLPDNLPELEGWKRGLGTRGRHNAGNSGEITIGEAPPPPSCR
jgi:hypothetical protein